MPPKIFQPSQYKEAAMQLLREGKTPEEVHTTIQLSIRTLYRYLAELQDEQANAQGGKVVESKPAGSKVITAAGPVQLAVVTTKTPGPIVFRMGDSIIDLDPKDLYDAFRYCEDIKKIEPAIDDNFSLMLKVAAKHLWEYFSRREASRVGVNLELE